MVQEGLIKVKSLVGKLNECLYESFVKLDFDTDLAFVTDSKRPDLCEYQCNAAMGLARKINRIPRELAVEIASMLKQSPYFSMVEVAGPGFINLKLSDDFLIQHITEMSQASYFGLDQNIQKKVILDFGGPNVAKPMHVGHLRSAIIGDCLQRLYRYLGWSVISDVHLGDWGTQMGMLIEEVRRNNPDLLFFQDGLDHYPDVSPVTLEDLEIMYPRAASRCKSDEKEMEMARTAVRDLQAGNSGYQALWKHFVTVSIEALKKDFSALDIRFDLWLGESAFQEKIPDMMFRLKKAGHVQESEGARVIFLEMQEGKEIPPIILQKTDGAYLYGTTDLAALETRVQNEGADQILYVVDKRQSLHFSQVFEAAKKTVLQGILI